MSVNPKKWMKTETKNWGAELDKAESVVSALVDELMWIISKKIRVLFWFREIEGFCFVCFVSCAFSQHKEFYLRGSIWSILGAVKPGISNGSNRPTRRNEACDPAQIDEPVDSYYIKILGIFLFFIFKTVFKNIKHCLDVLWKIFFYVIYVFWIKNKYFSHFTYFLEQKDFKNEYGYLSKSFILNTNGKTLKFLMQNLILESFLIILTLANIL